MLDQSARFLQQLNTMKKCLQSRILLCFDHIEEVEETFLLCKLQKLELGSSLFRSRYEDLKDWKDSKEAAKDKNVWALGRIHEKSI